MNYTELALEAKLIATSLPVNGSTRASCPVCKHNTYTVTRLSNSVVWNCYRLKCPVQGGHAELAASAPAERLRDKPKLNPYYGKMYPISSSGLAYFLGRFGLDAARAPIIEADHGYLLPVYDPRGMLRARVLRGTWSGQPVSPYHGRVGPKSTIYVEREGPLQGWHLRLRLTQPPLVLVEDTISAMCAAEVGMCAVALLGTNMTHGKAREIAQFGAKEVIIALDKDATDKAFEMAKTWGMAWPRTRVALLERDLKDEDNDDIPHLLGVHT